MSYIRAGHELRDFEGVSTSYVFPSGNSRERDKVFVENYDDTYEDNPTFAQLIINMMRRLFKEEGFEDEEYIEKVKKVLSEKLNVKVRVIE